MSSEPVAIPAIASPTVIKDTIKSEACTFILHNDIFYFSKRPSKLTSIMPTMIQTAGTPHASRPYIRGPAAPANALRLSAKHLSNPYQHTRGVTSRSERIKKAREFLMDSCPDKLKRLVSKGCEAIKAGTPVVIVCAYGRDRSQVVAEMIGESFHCGRVYYVHREEHF